MALKKQNESEPQTGFQDPTDFHYIPPEIEYVGAENLSPTDFHYVAPKDPIDWGSNDRNIVAIKEIAERLGVSPQELVDKPYSWQFLTAAVLAWWEGDHWGSKLEFNDHNEYQEERLLGPLARLFNIKRK